MNTKVDNDQVVAMSFYLPNKLIAERLEISERQVSRILKKNGRSKKDPENRKRNHDEFMERITIKVLHKIGMSHGAISYRFGLSRQAIEQKLIKNNG